MCFTISIRWSVSRPGLQNPYKVEQGSGVVSAQGSWTGEAGHAVGVTSLSLFPKTPLWRIRALLFPVCSRVTPLAPISRPQETQIDLMEVRVYFVGPGSRSVRMYLCMGGVLNTRTDCVPGMWSGHWWLVLRVVMRAGFGDWCGVHVLVMVPWLETWS